MAVRDSYEYDSSNLHLKGDDRKVNFQLETNIEKIILNFIRNPPNIPKRRYVIARNQLLSVYRRMEYYPEKKELCKFYENRIIEIIKLEKGKEK